MKERTKLQTSLNNAVLTINIVALYKLLGLNENTTACFVIFITVHDADDYKSTPFELTWK